MQLHESSLSTPKPKLESAPDHLEGIRGTVGGQIFTCGNILAEKIVNAATLSLESNFN